VIDVNGGMLIHWPAAGAPSRRRESSHEVDNERRTSGLESG
jgi:hypothetical protein